jgi:hypothetical protein
MNNQIKNILFYGAFGTFGAYTFYQVAQSEFQRKMKSQYYFDNMINSYKELETCNSICLDESYNHYKIRDITKKEEIFKSINPIHIKYDKNCKNEYDNFQKAYNKYKLHKYDICYKFAL